MLTNEKKRRGRRYALYACCSSSALHVRLAPLPICVHRTQPPAYPYTHPPRLQARQRLELRLEDKERQMGKLRGVIKELEDKLAEAFKRQADW